MLVQILRAPKHTWYKNKKLEFFDVIDPGDDRAIYLLSPKQLKKMKKATHLEIGIQKCDCDMVEEEDLSAFSIENILKAIGD